jgi:hypothetical protein
MLIRTEQVAVAIGSVRT